MGTELPGGRGKYTKDAYVAQNDSYDARRQQVQGLHGPYEIVGAVTELMSNRGSLSLTTDLSSTGTFEFFPIQPFAHGIKVERYQFWVETAGSAGNRVRVALYTFSYSPRPRFIKVAGSDQYIVNGASTGFVVSPRIHNLQLYPNTVYYFAAVGTNGSTARFSAVTINPKHQGIPVKRFASGITTLTSTGFPPVVNSESLTSVSSSTVSALNFSMMTERFYQQFGA